MDLVGGVKVKDGLFLGDEYAAQDLEFVVANKVTHVVNTAARQVPNHWEPIGVKYLDLYWLDHDVQQLFDPRDELIQGLCDFISSGLSLGESVLIHSIKGQNRSVAVVLVYLMRTQSWSMQKALDFVGSRRPGLAPRASFVVQVSAYEARLARTQVLTSHWDLAPSDPEQAILRNTYLNSRAGEVVETVIVASRDRQEIVHWPDNSANFLKQAALNPVWEGLVTLRSCLKGGRSRESIKVPIPVLPTPRKPGLKYAKPDSKPEPVTTDDLASLRRAKLDPPPPSEPLKKQRALSAGSKELKASKGDSALYRMRFAPMSKAANSLKSVTGSKSYAAYGERAGLEVRGKAGKRSRVQTAPGGKGKGMSRTLGARGNA